jgi:hypothetical protein
MRHIWCSFGLLVKAWNPKGLTVGIFPFIPRNGLDLKAVLQGMIEDLPQVTILQPGEFFPNPVRYPEQTGKASRCLKRAGRLFQIIVLVFFPGKI